MFASTVLIGRVLQRQGEPLADTTGILDFEFALTAAEASSAVSAWQAAGLLGTARFQLALDSAWVVFGYAPLAMLIGLAAFRAWEAHGPPRWRWAGVLAIGGAAAGGFDVAENLALVVVLSIPSQPWPLLAALAAAVKFTLIGLALAFAVIAFGAGGAAWLRTRMAS